MNSSCADGHRSEERRATAINEAQREYEIQ
jgi:hypothetical protein